MHITNNDSQFCALHNLNDHAYLSNLLLEKYYDDGCVAYYSFPWWPDSQRRIKVSPYGVSFDTFKANEYGYLCWQSGPSTNQQANIRDLIKLILLCYRKSWHYAIKGPGARYVVDHFYRAELDPAMKSA